MDKHVHLYFDDSGSRHPDHKPTPSRKDGMDCFALGGILINEGTDIDTLIKMHSQFMSDWKLNHPLHSTKIRGRREAFSWLKTDQGKEQQFLNELQDFLLSLPVLGIACVIDRPGYVARYAEKYGGHPWLMCRTALAILVERAAKYARQQDTKLEIFFEPSGEKEDTDIKGYIKELKSLGMPFDQQTSQNYGALKAKDFKEIVLGEPRERTKKTPMMQIADLFLYPMVKGGYDRNYPPYQALMQAGKIIDATLEKSDISSMGVKYSCFDKEK